MTLIQSTFKRNLLIGFGISLLLLAVSSIASFISIRNLMDSARQVAHTNQVRKTIDEVLIAAKEGEAGQRGYLLTDDSRYMNPYRGAHDRAKDALRRLAILISDNPDQKAELEKLKSLAEERFSRMEMVIDKKLKTGIVPTDLFKGMVIMEEMASVVQVMKDREQALLDERTNKMNRFAAATPMLIIVAASLAIFVTIFSFYRVISDFDSRVQMQQELINKDQETTERLGLIQGIAEKISAGNYTVRVNGEGRDLLGSISGSLNKMAESLEFSFSKLSQKEWLQRGIGELNEKLIGEKDLNNLSHNVLDFLSSYTDSQVGAFYLVNSQDSLSLVASMGLNQQGVQQTVQFGEGVVGIAAQSGKMQVISGLQDSEIVISSTSASFHPNTIIAFPVYHEQKLKAVIELAAIKEYPEVVKEFLGVAPFNIGMAIHSVRDHLRVQELLHETQTQAEELQSQHSELENINAELHAQSEKLQASDEELRVQQEELQQANLELEERSRLLEEKNEMIMERNIEIQMKAEELATSSRYKSEFLANMSHELRTPLNSILLLSRLLSENHEDNLSPDQVEYAKVIQSSGNGLLTLIDEILDLSKIESGKMELEYNDVNINDLVEDVSSMFSTSATEKGISFDVKINPGTPSLIETDRLRVEQVLRNLISNAMKFTASGGITVDVSSFDSSILFRVIDTGIGIPKEKQDTIFEAFQQADGSTRRKFGGTGLGLSISRQLARLLGGDVTVSSEEGKGSTFSFIVPLKKMENKEQSRDENDFAIPAYHEQASEPVSFKEKDEFIADTIPQAVPDDRNNIKKDDRVILIIEDDTAFAKSLLDFARRNKYKAIVAVRGDEGVAMAKKYLPLGILLDLQLPVKSGWEVMEELKSDPATRPIPVHMMSSYQMKTKSISKGAIDFINKPVAFEKMSDIFKKIEQALSREPKKVLIVEENHKHAEALAYFLDTFNVASEIKDSIDDGIKALNNDDVDCVILDMGIPSRQSYETLEEIKNSPGMEHLPIIIFTGKNLSHREEMRIRQYADSIVVKTAHSYQRILDEVTLFLHLVDQNNKEEKRPRYRKMGALADVLKGKKVLVADDDVRNIFSLSKSLEQYGMEVISAIDGKEAMKQLESNEKIDIVLMDMMMPEMDGYETTRAIRERKEFSNLPVIAVTAKAMTGDREKCIEAGASDYITKPVDVDQLVSLLRVWLYTSS
ncbi:response regulator [Flavihumibacter sp. ZG627]|uniref:response regulator n=1 Tax=Flavihumibacter sp. ZG627 TaxID=1463156 RepID=UPI00057F7D7A|nr:response regulator [Flavihumibacter sp. ZG627]KIC89557.1 histidine kinase [Flavihumibacter sp. ZG627]